MMQSTVGMPSLIADSLRAHALLFEKPLAPNYSAATGLRMLLAFVLVGVVVFFGFRFAVDAAGLRGAPLTNLAFVITLCAAFLLAQRSLVRAPLADVGLRAWAQWTRRERLYLCQVLPLALVIFALIFHRHLLGLVDKHGVAGFVLFSVFPGLAWGMVQEWLYRGWLQTELTRRFGGWAGLFAANVVFTFGPLHLNYFGGAAGVNWAGLVAVFGIGLLFGVIYQRSGNLWIPALLHGIWPLNMS